jgi:hypothetical protein
MDKDVILMRVATVMTQLNAMRHEQELAAHLGDYETAYYKGKEQQRLLTELILWIVQNI